MTYPDYEAACKRAATQQGLDPLTEGLKAAGVKHAVEQTGGFCMVITTSNDSGVVVAICDGEDPHGTERVWLTAFYPGDTWTEGGEAEDERTTTLADAIKRMEQHARG